jgi:hypothetical protein
MFGVLSPRYVAVVERYPLSKCRPTSAPFPSGVKFNPSHMVTGNYRRARRQWRATSGSNGTTLWRPCQGPLWVCAENAA